MKTKWAKGAMKSIKSFRLKPYVRKVFPGDTGGQTSFPGLENKAFFDLGLQVKPGQYKKALSHLKKYRTAYEIAGSTGGGFAGASIAHRRYKRKMGRRRK